MWKAFENEINKAQLESLKKSIEKMKGHLSRHQAIKDRSWERGTPFASPAVQSFAKQKVTDEVEKRTNKNICQAEAILSLIVSDLTRQGLDDCAVVSQESQEDMHALSFLLDNAKHAIQCIQSSGLNLRNARLLTGFCAIMCPVTGNYG